MATKCSVSEVRFVPRTKRERGACAPDVVQPQWYHQKHVQEEVEEGLLHRGIAEKGRYHELLANQLSLLVLGQDPRHLFGDVCQPINFGLVSLP